MRRFTAILTISAIIAAGFPSAPSYAQPTYIPASTTTGPTADELALLNSTINANLYGGPALKQAISDLVVKYPHLASAIASELKNDSLLTPEQKEAIFAGLSDGLNRLGIVAQANTGLDPLLIALVVGGFGLVGTGVYFATKKNNDCTVSCN